VKAALSRSRPHAWLWLAVIAVCAVGCKKSSPTREPDYRVDDDIAMVESELDRAEAELRSEGIAIPQPAPAEPPPPQPPPEPTETIETDDDDAAPELEEPPMSAAEPADAGEERVERQRAGFFSRWLARRRAKKAKSERCERVCDLADAICELRDRVCDLAERHRDDTRYEDACLRADDQCRAARDACSACDG
jgi:hypothetical protein